MDYKKIALVVISIIIVVGLGVLTFLQKKGSATQTPLANDTQTIKLIDTEPKRIDFGTNIPTDFLNNIPLVQGVKIEQSYSLNYVGQKQLTIVFTSMKSVKENYILYTDFLKVKGWNISNKYESPKLYSFYATKESDDINVTISEDTSSEITKSRVSISILKK